MQKLTVASVRQKSIQPLNKLLVCVFAPLLLSISGWLSAAQWTTQASVSVSEFYTDNVRLSQNSEADDFITELTTAFSVKADGARIDVDFNYSVSYFDYKQDDNLDDLRQAMRLSSSFNLIPNNLVLEVDSAITQQLISSRLQGSGSVVGSSNVLDTFTSSAEALWNSKLGNFAVLSASFELNQVDYIAGSNSGGTSTFQSDSIGQKGRFVLANADELKRIFWSANYLDSRIDYETQEQAGEQSGSVTIGYRWDHVRVNADAGWSRYRYLVSFGGAQPDNDFTVLKATWTPSRKVSVGLFQTVRNYSQGTLAADAKRKSVGGDITWNPSVRTSLQASTSNAFYGDSYGFSFTHRTKKSNWFANYSESVTDSRRLITSTGDFISVCPIGSLTPFDPGCTPKLPNTNITAAVIEIPFRLSSSDISGEEFISKNAVIGYSYSAARTTIGWSLFQTERIYLTSVREEKDKGIRMNVTWNVGRFSTVTLIANQTQRVFGDGTDGDFLSSDLVFNRKIGRKTSASIVLHVAENVDVSSNNSYSENHIRLQLTTSLN
ncbi:MAG: TIGR03016 family PEP-CTERM system-associated outer membrane protein [Pseudomonadales bacterium]|nr:TIGR03016 family PEP-CTERM system-associated outer membrane protein [Pseudomonadales bacterium]